MNLLTLIETTRKNKSEQLLLHTGAIPKCKKKNEWQSLSDEALSPSLCREVCLSMLTQEQKHHLQEFGYIYGVARIASELKIQFSITNHDGGLTGFFKVVNLQVKESSHLGLPSLLQESVARAQSGWIMITGFENTGKTSVAYSLLHGANQNRSYHVICMEDLVQIDMKSNKSTFSQLATNSDEIAKCNRYHFIGAQIVLLDVGLTLGVLSLVCELINMGKQVILVFNHGSIESAFNAIIEIESLSEDKKNILLNNLLSAIGVRLVESSQEEKILSYEYMIGTAVIKSHIKNKNWPSIYNDMRTQGETTGMRTLNQSLLGHIMKRKIDLKSAFEVTTDPEDLDQLLKKVGI